LLSSTSVARAHPGHTWPIVGFLERACLGTVRKDFVFNSARISKWPHIESTFAVHQRGRPILNFFQFLIGLRRLYRRTTHCVLVRPHGSAFVQFCFTVPREPHDASRVYPRISSYPLICHRSPSLGRINNADCGCCRSAFIDAHVRNIPQQFAKTMPGGCNIAPSFFSSLLSPRCLINSNQLRVFDGSWLRLG
jgi:hypothetical protein